MKTAIFPLGMADLSETVAPNINLIRSFPVIQLSRRTYSTPKYDINKKKKELNRMRMIEKAEKKYTFKRVGECMAGI